MKQNKKLTVSSFAGAKLLFNRDVKKWKELRDKLVEVDDYIYQMHANDLMNVASYLIEKAKTKKDKKVAMFVLEKAIFFETKEREHYERLRILMDEKERAEAKCRKKDAIIQELMAEVSLLRDKFKL